MQAAVAALAAAADVDTPRGSLLRLAKAVPGPAPAGVVRQVAGHPKCRLDVLAVLALTEARRGRRIPRALRDAAGGASLTTLDVLEQISPTTAVLAALAGEWAGTASGLAQAAAGVAG